MKYYTGTKIYLWCIFIQIENVNATMVTEKNKEDTEFSAKHL